MPVADPVRIDEPTIDESVDAERPWIVLVWNDPINLMSYVTLVFQQLFGYSLEKATALMLDVHEKGRAVVSNGSAAAKSSRVRTMALTSSAGNSTK